MDRILSSLNPAQREAVTTTEGPVLILAGAGSGKTRVIIHRMAYILLEGRASPSEILAMTFTNKAAAQMRERVGRLFGADLRGLWICTFHSLGARLLRIHAKELGLSPNFTIHDEEDAGKVLKAAVKECGLDPARFTPESVRSWMDRKKFALVNPELAGDEDRRGAFLDGRYSEVFECYRRRMAADNAVDFDDLITLSARLFIDRPDVAEHYRRRFKYIFVDEYQDTNRAQYHLCRLLAPGADSNICVVGDEDQSIYSWRGADIRNILDFEKDYPRARTFHLMQNYRSTETILEAAAKLISHNTQRRKTQRLWTSRRGGFPVSYRRYADGREEAAATAACIEDIVLGNPGGSYGDIAVFYRVHAQSRALETELVRRRIPYRTFGGPRFYERREIKDLLAYLRVFSNPLDRISLLRIINVPARKIGKTTVERSLSAAESMDLPLYAFLEHAEGEGLGRAASARLKKLHSFLEKWRLRFEDLSDDSELVDVVRDFIEDLGYVDYLVASKREDRVELVDEFLAAVAEKRRPGLETDEEQGRPEKVLARFLAEVTLAGEQDQQLSTGGLVTLSTLHNAKGLEFPVVFMIGMDEGLLPYHVDGEDYDRLEEERRLCYVGFTRAMDRLYLSGAMRRFLWGRPTASIASRFLVEAGLARPAAGSDALRRRWDEPFPDHEFADDFWDD